MRWHHLPYKGGEFVELLRAARDQLDLFLAAAIGGTAEQEAQCFCDVWRTNTGNRRVSMHASTERVWMRWGRRVVTHSAS